MASTSNENSGAPAGQGNKPVVCFLGPISSYTHQATLETFPEDKFKLMPVTTIKDIFDTTQSGEAAYGVVPFENSTNGSVVFTLDHFADRGGNYPDLSVCAEIYLDVHHCLLGHAPPLASSAAAAAGAVGGPSDETPSSGQATPTPSQPHPPALQTLSATGAGGGSSKPVSKPLRDLSRVRRIYSHPQAFGQCSRFLSAYFPSQSGVETVDVSSTSRAAELARDDPSGETAAIGSAIAADLLSGLDVLARDIEDRDDNTTRFFVLRSGGAGGGSGSEGQEEIPGLTNRTPRPRPAMSPVAATAATTNPAAQEQEQEPATKSLLSFTVPHTSPGALADVLECFRAAGLNLTSIASRPANGSGGGSTDEDDAQRTTVAPASALEPLPSFTYIFFAEFEGHRFRDAGGRVARVLDSVARVARTSRWLGSWLDMRAGSPA